MMMLILLVSFLALECSAFLVNSRPLKSNLNILRSTELDVGEFENVVFTKESSVKDNINKYKLAATLKPKETNSFLAEYKEEMKRRGVVFPGFRSGKLPPYVMPDVRRYIVCFGLETLLGQLCNLNSLEICDENGNDVPFGEDSFYDEIIQDTPAGRKFADQRDSWKENTDFSFVANFYARVIEESEPQPADESNVVVDAEVVQG